MSPGDLTWFQVIEVMHAAQREPFPWATYILGGLIIVCLLLYLWSFIFQGDEMRSTRVSLLLGAALLGFVLVGMGGCASVGAGTPAIAATADSPAVPAQSGLQVAISKDLAAAIEKAKAATDGMAPQRVICYEYIQSLVPEIPSLSLPDVGKPAGIFDAFEIGAEAAENVQEVAEFQIPPEVKIAFAIKCGPLKARAGDLLTLFNLKIARVAGKVAFVAK